MSKNEEKKITIQQMRELVAQESWVRSPYIYTKLGAGLSLIQQQALLMVSSHLQSYIKNFYNLHLDRSKNRPKALFSEHVLKNGIPPFRIYLADLGVKPNNYKEARQAINEINLQVEHPEIDADGNQTTRTLLTNVFSQFGFEETGEYYHFDDKETNERQAVALKNPYIDVKINPDVAEWAFDMSEGYVNHLKLIASYSSKRPTPRLYLMLMNRTKKGEKQVIIPLTDLKEYLGIVPYKNEKGEMVIPYPKFANFRQKVLDAVRDDLNRMAKENHTDITFTYEPVYPGTRKKGDPEAIKFHVERTVLGDAYNVVVNHKKSELLGPEPVQQEIFTDGYADVFKKCIEDISSKAETDDAKAYFSSLQYINYNKDSGVLMVMVPSQEVYQWLESDKVLPYWYSFLRKHFGKKLTLNYQFAMQQG